MGFAENLQRLRESAGLSQSGLATKSGIPLRSIQNWEQGHRTPRADVLLSLAKALGVGVDSLLTGQPPPATPTLAQDEPREGGAGRKPAGRQKRPGRGQKGKKGG